MKATLLTLIPLALSASRKLWRPAVQAAASSMLRSVAEDFAVPPRIQGPREFESPIGGERDLAQSSEWWSAPPSSSDLPPDSEIHPIETREPGAAEGMESAWRTVLEECWAKTRAKAPAAGPDGTTVSEFQKELDRRLSHLAAELQLGIWRPSPPLTHSLAKGQGQTRSIALFNLRDRLALAAIARQVSAAVDSAFVEGSWAYRPNRGVQQGVERAATLMNRGHRWALQLDVRDCFDTIPHQAVLRNLDSLPCPPDLWPYVRLALEAPQWNKGSLITPWRGLPQGSPLSPVLCNVFFHPLDLGLRWTLLGHALRYADDFLLVARTQGTVRRMERFMTNYLLRHRMDVRRLGPPLYLGSANATLTFLGHDFVGGRTIKCHPAAPDS